MGNKTDLWLLKYALNFCIWIMLIKKITKITVGPPSSGFLWQLANKQKGACPPPTELECGSLTWDLIDRYVPFQIMSNQLNWPQVDSSRVEEINQGWSVETQRVWAPFWVSWLRLWVLEFLFLRNLQRFQLNIFHIDSMGCCLQTFRENNEFNQFWNKAVTTKCGKSEALSRCTVSKDKVSVLFDRVMICTGLVYCLFK